MRRFSDSDYSVLQVRILGAVNQYALPFFFFITTRPEHKIRQVLNETALGFIIVRLVLDDKYLPDADIRTFLVTKFQDTKQRHPSSSSLLSSPPKGNIERVVQMSSGQFIYASTVVKFIASDSHKYILLTSWAIVFYLSLSVRVINPEIVPAGADIGFSPDRSPQMHRHKSDS